MKVELQKYIDSSKIGDLLSNLLEQCFSNKAKDPKAFIARYCSSDILDSMKESKNEYKRKYANSKNEREELKRKLAELRLSRITKTKNCSCGEKKKKSKTQFVLSDD